MTKKLKRGLFVGRFQPFHLGHLSGIKTALGQVEELIIVVGSAEYSHSEKNPFTAGERVEMILAALKEANIDPAKYVVIPVRDVHIHATWVPFVVSQVPKFDIVFTNEPLTSRLFKERGYMVERIPFFERAAYSATEIRERILKGKNWESLVPKSVAELLASFGGIERIRELATSDNPSRSER
ncbi:nicotinamide-nucleotide adenylyltransferase [[Eubacterium] cellulosolvens]